MGLRFTLAQIRAKAREQFDLPETPATNKWPSNTALNGLINDALDDVMGTLSKGQTNFWYETTVTGTITPPADSIAVPADFVRLSDGPLLSTDAGTTYFPLANMVRGLEFTRTETPATPYGYALVNGSIQLATRPDALVSIRYRYVRHTGGLSTDADIFDGPHGWATYALAFVGEALAIKARENTVPWVTKKAQAFEKFARQASVIDENAIEQVEDVRGRPAGTPVADQDVYSWLRSGPAWRRYP